MKAYQTYHEIDLSTDVMSASSHRLIQLLLEKCLQNIELAKSYMSADDVVKKCQSISKSMYIVNYLRACLNFKVESALDLSERLELLYFFVERRLLLANSQNKIEYLNEATQVIAIIKSGWDGIASLQN